MWCLREHVHALYVDISWFVCVSTCAVQGVDLRKYSREIEVKLRREENQSIDDCITPSHPKPFIPPHIVALSPLPL